MVPLSAIRPSIFSEIEKTNPGINPQGFICQADLTNFRSKHIQDLLISEKGEISDLEQEVIESLSTHELMVTDLRPKSTENYTFGQRLADRIASFGGSWTFLITFFSFLLIWMLINIVALRGRPFDPYPFILLNLLLSCIAAIQAPVIMMSQNRQEEKDRVRSEQDFQINLKAELEIRNLHEKMDHLLMHQWERLVEIQQVQIEMLQELRNDQTAGKSK